MTELQLYLKTYLRIPDENLERASSFFTSKKIPKGDFYLKSGTKSNFLGFVQSGIVREYVTLETKEVTKWIDTRGYFLLDLAGFFFDQPAIWQIQALTDCEILVISKEDYFQMGSEIDCWHEFEKLFITKCCTLLEDRLLTMLSMTSEERYRHFADYKGEMFKEVPLGYIASMLGIPLETSRDFKNRDSNQP